MKKLEVKHIDKVLVKFLKNHNIKCKVNLDTDFFYYYETNEIGYSVLVTERTANLFPSFTKKLGLKYEVPIFILCFLHEVGHYFTFENFEEDELYKYRDIKVKLGDSDEDFEKYYNIPDELAATMWAIDFINNNPQDIENLDKELCKAFKKFISINNIEE